MSLYFSKFGLFKDSWIPEKDLCKINWSVKFVKYEYKTFEEPFILFSIFKDLVDKMNLNRGS